MRHHSLACRVVHYERTVPNRTADRSSTLTLCKTKDGWRMMGLIRTDSTDWVVTSLYGGRPAWNRDD